MQMSNFNSHEIFKQRMLNKLKNSASSFPLLDHTESTSSIFQQLWSYRKVSLTEQNYCKEKSSSFTPVKESILLHLILGKKFYKYINQSQVRENPLTESEHLELFKHYLYRFDLEKALECINKCTVMNPKKYQKWKALTLFHFNKLDVKRDLGNSKDWEKEALMLEVFISKSELKANELLIKDEYFGALAWVRLFWISCHPEKEKIMLNVVKKLIDKYPNGTEGYFLAIILMYKKDLLQAGELCDLIFERSKDLQVELKVFLKILQAKILFKQSKLSQSMDSLKELYMEHPTFPQILFYFGKICVLAGRQNTLPYGISALKNFRKFDNKNNEKALFYLVKGYAARNQVCRAVKNSIKLESNSLSSKHKKVLSNIEETYQHEIKRLKTGDLTVNISQDFCLDIEMEQLIKSKNFNEALKKLKNLQIRQEFEMKYYIREIQILKLLTDTSFLQKHNELLKIITNNKVVSSQWVKSILFYVKNTVELDSFEDAIRILTCIGYVYPGLPLDLPFVNQTYNTSKSIKDIVVTVAADTEDLKGRRKAEQLVVTYSEMVSSPQQRRYSSQIPRPSFFKPKKDARDSSHLLQPSKPQPERVKNTPTSLFTCAFPIFLYKIGKYAAVHKVKEFEGILSLKDFIQILSNFNFVSEIKQKFLPRAQFYLLLLFKNTHQERLFDELLQESKENLEFQGLLKLQKNLHIAELFN